MIEENTEILLALAVLSVLLGFQHLSVSISIASISLISLGSDITLLTGFLKLVRLFATPIDELLVGGVLTAFLGIFYVKSAWNYFVSQLDQLQ